MNSLKEINTKKAYSLSFDDMINIKNIDLDIIKSGKKSNNIKCIASKNIRYVNSLYLIIDEISGHNEESNGEDKDVLNNHKKSVK